MKRERKKKKESYLVTALDLCLFPEGKADYRLKA
jgi:hypothetical protein